MFMVFTTLLRRCVLLVFSIVLILSFSDSNAQCAYNSGGSTTITCTSNAPFSGTVSCSNMLGNRIFRISGLSASCRYRISTCGQNNFDTQLTIYPQGGGTALATNDDNGPGCTGLQASIDFTPPSSGIYDIKLNQFNCVASTTPTTVSVTLLSCDPVGSCPVGLDVDVNAAALNISCSRQQTPIGSGTFRRFNVVNGATYEFETCASPAAQNTQLTGYNSGGTAVFFNDDNGPTCSGNKASVQWNSSFSGVLRINLNEFPCTGFTNTTSAILGYRQINNIDVSGSPTFACTGEVVELVASPGGGTWTASGGGTISGNEYTTNASGSYNLTYTLGACSQTYNFQIGTNSIAPSSITSSAGVNICTGASTILTAVGGTLGGAGAEYVWYADGCGVTELFRGNPFPIPSVSQSGRIYVGIEGGCNPPATCAFLDLNVTNPSTLPSSISVPGQVCAGESLTININGGNLVGGAQWALYSGSCQSTILQQTTGSSFTIIAPAVPTEYFVGAVGGVCPATPCVSVSVTPLTPPSAPSIINKSIDNFCAGLLVTLSINDGVLGSGGTWTWYEGVSCCGTPIGTGTSIFQAPTTTTIYYVRSEATCGNTSPISTTVTVKSLSVAPTSISSSRDVTCAFPTPTDVTLTQVGGTLGTNATWELWEGECPTSGGTFVSSNITGVFTVSPATTTDYFIRAIGDCNASGTSCASKTITVSQGLGSVNVSGTNPLCFNGADGTATATPSGGLTPYAYVWSNGQTTQTAIGLNAGSYSVTVTDAGGCQQSGSVNLSNLPLLQVTNVNVVNVTCGGGNDGSITISANGGTGTLQFSIDGGQNYQLSNSFPGLQVGNYDILVQDVNGCTATSSPSSFTITSPTAISVSATGTDASCVGVNDGTITASATGGTGNIQYSINGSPLQPGGFFNNLSAGSYTVLAQDQIGCQASTTVTIDNLANLTLSIINEVDVSCFGANDGSFEVVPNGGTNPYEYTINGFTFQPSGIFTGLVANTYNVLVRDARGCQNNTAVTIIQPASLFANISNQTNIGCFGGGAGSLTVNVSGGALSYSYLWSDGQTTQTATNLVAGPYTVTVTDNNGCTVSTGATITEAPQLFLNLASQSDVSCDGGTNGRLDISVTGGTPPYSFSWSNGATTEDLVNVIAGNYDVTVTDGNGCALVGNYTLNEPAPLVLNLQGTDPAFCFPSGSIDLTVSGGVATYTYLWSNFQTTEDIIDLSGGTYTVIVTDANGCTSSASTTLVDPAGINVVETITNASCVGTTDGSIELTVTGGSGIYDFNWFDNNFNFISNNKDIFGLAAGVYNLDVFDFGAGFCFARYTFVVGEDGPAITSQVTNASCDGSVLGSIDVTVTGGTAPYTYLWNTGATTQDLNNLLAGAFSVTVTDDNGCITSSVVGVSQGNIAVIPTVTNPTCNGGTNGSVTLSVSNATPPLSYNWSNGANTQNISGLSVGTYVVSVTDGAGCIGVEVFTLTNPLQITISQTFSSQSASCNGAFNSVGTSVAGGTAPYTYLWSNGTTSQDLNNVLPGNYTVIVTDANGCTAARSWQLGFPANAPTATLDITNAGCSGQNTGAIDITISFATPPTTVSYLWSNGETTEDISNVGAGLYSLTVTYDACQQVFSANIQNASPITAVNMFAVNGDCSGATGSVSASPVGGSASYTYAWSNSATTATVNGLVAGTYTVTVISSEGCSATNSVNISQAGTFNLSASTTNAGCNGASNASIFVTPLNATLPVTYNWSNGATTKDLLNVSAGTYTVTATDDAGCVRVSSYTVTEPSTIIVTTVNVQNSDCANSVTGSIDISINGGTGGYTFLWTNGATTQNITNLIAGTYTVVVTDVSGCSTTESFTITDPSGLVVSGTATDVSCNGAADGEIIGIVATGGTPNYTYLWSNNETTQDISGLSGGVYAVTVTDDLGCQATAGFVIDEPSIITLSASNTNVTCNGSSNGAINVSVNGGTSPYNYLWSNGETTAAISGLTAGNYSVTVTDDNGCAATTTVNLAQPTVLNVTANAVGAACNGGNTGSINLNVSGGFAPYTFAWSNGATTQNVSNLAAGPYSVTVTDANSCTNSQTFTITAPAPIVVTTLGTDADCANGILGTVDATVTGGNAPFLYLWNNLATTQNIAGLYAGTYVITVTDANNCSATDSYTVIDISNTINVTGTVTDVSCPNATDGEIDITVTGGTPAYNYSWNTGATTEDLTGLAAGNYAFTVVDAQGCGYFAGFTVGAPDSILISAVVVDGACGGGAGSIDLTVSGGLGAPYGFQWSNGASTEDLPSVLAGTYFVTVIDGGGCSNVAFFNVSANGGNLDVIAAINNVACNGGSDGDIFTTVIGGTPPYTYQWSTGDITSDLVNVATGSYIVTVADAGGCVKIQTFVVTQPTSLQIASALVLDSDCFGGATGSVDLIVNGGTAPYSYLWSNFNNTQDLSNAAAGIYSVIVTDANGCTIGAQYTVGEATEILVTEVITNVSCNGGNDGEIALSVSGGSAPYSYTWSNNASTATISQLTIGNYSVTVEDDNGCSVVRNYNISEPAVLALTGTVTDVTCNGGVNGSVNISVAGGTSPYTYLWSPGGVTTEDLTAVSANQYTLVVEDANGCTISGTYDVNEPSAIQVTVNISNVSCNGGTNGSVDVSVTGGSPVYSYSWSNGSNLQDLVNVPAGTYILTVTDASGCTSINSYTVTQPDALLATASITNVSCFGGSDGEIDVTVTGGTANYTFLWSNGTTTEDLTGLTAGIYGVTVTDANNCVFSTTFTVIQPSQLSITFTKVDVSCFGENNGSIDVTVSGGTPGYTYLWSNGETTEDISTLAADNYIVIVTDNNGCTISSTISVIEPAELVATAVVNNVTCSGANNGSINLTVTGGTFPYSYAWNNGLSSQNLTNVGGGTYSVTITDGNGCSFTDTYTITEPTQLVINVSTTNPACFGGSDGEIDITVSGGTPSYTYAWSNGETTEDISGLVEGVYTVTVTDNNGCTLSNTIIITQPASIQIVATVNNVTCFGANDGSIEVTGFGGTGILNYSWSNGATTKDIFNLSAGNYDLTVLDANNCGAVFNFTITEPAELLPNAVLTNISCFGDSTGVIDLNVTGGTPGYNYIWNNGETSEDLLGLVAGSYAVTITDASGCVSNFTYAITEPADLVITLTPTSATCSEVADGAIDLTVSGGVAPYTFFWSTFEFTEDIGNLAGGRYVVIVTDANGCTSIDSVLVNVPQQLTVTGIPKGAGCGDDDNGEIGVTVNGGTTPYTYSWSDGATTEDRTNLPAGNYCITVTDANGCEAVYCTLITGLPKPIVDFSFNNACVGEPIQMFNTTQLSSGTLTYEWNFGDGTSSQAPNPSRIYTASGDFDITLVARSDRGCLDTLTKVVTIYATPDATITISGALPGACVTDTAFLSVAFDANYLYLWSNGATTNAITTTQSGNYRVTVTSVNGCSDVDAADVFVLNQDNVTISNDTTVSLGYPVELVVTGGATYLWTPASGLDNPTSATPIATPDETTTYTVTISDLNGCNLELSVTITVTEDFSLGIPNLISPNGDGINDVWNIFNVETYPGTSVIIFNRWGSKVWESDDYANDWTGTSQNGNELPDGTYFYVIQVGGSDRVFKGDVNILR
jgi:gliding motility-associated-like protein